MKLAPHVSIEPTLLINWIAVRLESIAFNALKVTADKVHLESACLTGIKMRAGDVSKSAAKHSAGIVVDSTDWANVLQAICLVVSYLPNDLVPTEGTVIGTTVIAYRQVWRRLGIVPILDVGEFVIGPVGWFWQQQVKTRLVMLGQYFQRCVGELRVYQTTVAIIESGAYLDESQVAIRVILHLAHNMQVSDGIYIV